MNYTGGTGTITINTSTGKITKAKYKMIVKTEIRNITLSGQKFKSIAMDCSKVDTFRPPAVILPIGGCVGLIANHYKKPLSVTDGGFFALIRLTYFIAFAGRY